MFSSDRGIVFRSDFAPPYMARRNQIKPSACGVWVKLPLGDKFINYDILLYI